MSGEERHCIRLRAAWERLDSDAGLSLRRSFHRPTGLDDCVVELVVESSAAPIEVRLNDERLGEVASHASARFDITRRLLPGNRLELRSVLTRSTPTLPAPPTHDTQRLAPPRGPIANRPESGQAARQGAASSPPEVRLEIRAATPQDSSATRQG